LVTSAAFRAAVHTSNTEEFVVEALRSAGSLTVSRVATHDDEVIGHVAISPVEISSKDLGWYGLGPISVLPAYQRRGIGSALAMDALLSLASSGAAGCVVLGDPAFYARFGFEITNALILPGVPPGHFMAVSFGGAVPTGTVSYHEAFQAEKGSHG
jgi:putative acetyltransferase